MTPASPRHFLNTQDWSRAELDALLTQAALFKRNRLGSELKGRSIALVFFNPSMRTRTSFELGAFHLGGHAVVLQPGKDAWPIEFDLGMVMDGDTEEHIAEVARVLGRYVDLIGVRAFPKFVDWEQDRQDKVLQSFARYSPVPVINMETITHPCQELAHALALQERFGTSDLRGKKYVLTWTYHPKALNTAVANSALTIATRMGMDVTLLCPTPDYVLDERYMGWARDNVAESGGSLKVNHDIDSAYDGADVVYAKSWGALPYFGQWHDEKPIRDQFKHFIVDERKMALTNAGVFSHCLPLRRNVKATDAVMDSPNCIAIDEAENRLHVQKAVMAALIAQPGLGTRDSGLGTRVSLAPRFFILPCLDLPMNTDVSVDVADSASPESRVPGPGLSKDIVLAFSGGLDTSFCVPYLKERGWNVHTVFADTGGVDAEERAFIEQRAAQLGVASHVTVDGGPAIWAGFVKPFVWAGEGYQGQYPLLVSDRYLIVDAALARAKDLGTNAVAHGCTGMGNDQVRFDLAVKASGDYRIVAPIREIQKEHTQTRAYEQAYLEERGFGVRSKQKQYTINENLLGVTLSGAEIDSWEAPGDGARGWCARREQWPTEALEVTLRFVQGEAVALDGAQMPGDKLLARLNTVFAQYGVGRGMYTGDTTIGLKGRIVYEAPGLAALLTAHRALEEAVLSKQQNRFKPEVGRKWVELVYEGFFHDPLKTDLEAFLAASQAMVNGEVVLRTDGGRVDAVAVRSPHILNSAGATYAQSADWGVEEAEGFIKLFGMSSTLWAQVNGKD